MARIELKNARPIFMTNFAGDPKRDNFGSAARKVTLVIPDEKVVKDLIRDGVNVRETRPREGEEEGYIPEHFVTVNLNFNAKFPPKVYLISGNSQVLLDEEDVGMLDTVRIKHVNAIVNPYQYSPSSNTTLYVSSMQVVQDLEDDPYAAEYIQRKGEQGNDTGGTDDPYHEDELPF